MNAYRSLIAAGALLPQVLFSQLRSDADVLYEMRNQVRYLSSDRLEGREAGTPGERLAVDYIAAKFGNVGLMPYGDSATYIQAFHFQAEPVLGEANSLQLGREKLVSGTDYSVLPFSANGVVRGKVLRVSYGIQAPELDRDDYAGLDPKGRIVAISVSSPDGIHPHSKFLAFHDLRIRAEKAKELGATGVVFYNDDPAAESPTNGLSSKVKDCGIPVIFLQGDRYEELLVTNNPVVMDVVIQREERTAYNVVGMLDFGKQDIVVIGAHLDHLGWGDEGSLHRGEKAIHNGADDNASGIAVMLALAEDLANMEHIRANNYLFIAFSGEEKGLYGSNHWTKHPTLPIARLNYMINLDMVGRLDSNNTIGVNGVGTSPAWAEVDHTQVENLKAKTTTSGIGPSDHTSFYLQGVPAIHFFTGSHADYHKPSDDEEKIDYNGMLRITRYIESLIGSLNDDGKLAFTKTEDVNTENTPRFKVTLGVVPDYLYDGRGMRIDGITEGRPAAEAGLKVGDVVVKLGAIEVTDMMAYMKGLSQFEKGDTAPVKVLRDGKELETNVTF
ncbi:MAG: M28 family peptidase [Flavobacteriales bacterium]|jgi:aminopeptidase YwaD|nr:M28 family peptidase [Flavobacteriales bacterium]MBK6881531.1 M28 family peptidase [Flavobacteriales bacterium]MBK7102848.1 M28 family peptidase [Flavobacteriales bacterium]MBK7113547.1 M28 family peptidase [Flavobacteriales bacterium]MBK7482468.1 M28 family peptidase [Flavobacteriales bacterium]